MTLRCSFGKRPINPFMRRVTVHGNAVSRSLQGRTSYYGTYGNRLRSVCTTRSLLHDLENNENGLFHQTLKVPDLTSDDVEAGAPELDALDVDAEAVGEGDGVGETGGGEEVVVVGAEGVGRFEVASVEAEAEQQAEGVGVVVEGWAVIMAFTTLHYFIQAPTIYKRPIRSQILSQKPRRFSFLLPLFPVLLSYPMHSRHRHDTPFRNDIYVMTLTHYAILWYIPII
jgi:hypothetical protein